MWNVTAIIQSPGNPAEHHHRGKERVMSDTWAIIIRTDHLSGPDAKGPDGYPDPEGDITGKVYRQPGDRKSQEWADTLKELSRLAEVYPVRRNRFKAYDDDGILYYTGDLYWQDNGDGEPSEDTLYLIHRTFEAEAGCTRVTYMGHKEWEIG